METQKIVNLLNGSDNENSKFATKKWYIIDSESNGNYSHHNPIKFLTKSIESSLCDYSDAHIIVTGNIAVTRTSSANPNANSAVEKKVKEPRTAATQVGFENCAPFIVHMIIQQVMIKFLLILSKNISFQELKLKITTSKSKFL